MSLPQEAELFEASFYGLTKRVQALMMQNVPLNCTTQVCFFVIKECLISVSTYQ